MKTRGNTINGIDIQRDYLSIAQYSPEDNSVALVAIQPFTGEKGVDHWDQVAAELKNLKTKFRFATPDIICSLPAEHAVIKHIMVDQTENDQRDILEWEMSQQIIGSLDDYAFDFEESGRVLEQGAREFLAVAYRTETVSRLSGIVRSLKLNPLVVDLDMFALANVFEANYREHISAPAVIVHGESERTKLVLVQNGTFIDFDVIDYEYGSLDPLGYADRIEPEIGSFLSLNGIGGPTGVYLAGSIFTQQEFVEACRNKVGGAEVLQPFRKVACRTGIDEERIGAYAAQLAVAVGAALRGND